MKKIKLTKGKFALVDDADFEWLSKWKWHCNAQDYAVREQSLGNGKSKMIRMHRLINDTPEGMDTDHINRNRLDNRRKNLRTLSHQKNLFNRNLPANSTSGVRGVSWFGESRKWRAYITVKDRQIHLGLYSDKQLAVIARKKAESFYHAI